MIDARKGYLRAKQTHPHPGFITGLDRLATTCGIIVAEHVFAPRRLDIQSVLSVFRTEIVLEALRTRQVTFSLARSLPPSFIHPFISFIHSFARSCVQSLIHSFLLLLIHSFINLLARMLFCLVLCEAIHELPFRFILFHF